MGSKAKFIDVRNHKPLLLEKLGNALSAPGFSTNWRHLANAMGKNLSYIQLCELAVNPVKRSCWIGVIQVMQRTESDTSNVLPQQETKQSQQEGKKKDIVICVLTARGEEAFAARLIFEQEGKVKFDSPVLDEKFCYQRGVLQVGSYKADIIISFSRELGEIKTLDVTKDFINEFQPTFALMTGVCAGNREKTKLGDIVIAEKAFYFNAGEETNDSNKPSPVFFGPDEQFLNWVKFTMKGKEEWKQYPKVDPSLSKRFKKQWLVRAFYEYARNRNESEWLSKSKFDASKPIPLNDCVKQMLGEVS